MAKLKSYVIEWDERDSGEAVQTLWWDERDIDEALWMFKSFYEEELHNMENINITELHGEED